MTLTTKHQRLAALRPLSPESVASLAAAWDVRMEPSSYQFRDLTKLIQTSKRQHRKTSLQLMGSGRDARATWRGRLARRRIDQLADLGKLIKTALDPFSSPNL